MGNAINFKCRNCKYETGVAVGCGLHGFGGKNWVPALDKTLKEIVAVNINEVVDENRFTLYTDLVLNKKPFFRLTPRSIRHGNNEFMTKYNFCPKCEKYQLDCEESGIMWD